LRVRQGFVCSRMKRHPIVIVNWAPSVACA
jgi:hypothetical protein